MSSNAPAEIDAKQVLFSVKQELRMSDTTDHDAWLTVLIDQAMRRIGTTETLIMDNCTMTVEDNRFKLPDNAKELVAFRTKGSCIEGVLVDFNFFQQCGCSITASSGFINGFASMLQKVGRWMYFINTITDGTEIEIAFTKINRDCNGMMAIHEECELALINYACWRFSNAFQNTQNYTNNQIQNWRKDYMDQSARCRGIAAVRTKDQQRAQINSKFNAILTIDSRPFSSIFANMSQFWYSQSNP